MGWEPWSKAEPTSLARYVTAQAAALLTLPADWPTMPRYELVRELYGALQAQGIPYLPERYNPVDELQDVRAPEEVLRAPRGGTCLDLAALFCGVCLAVDMVPLLIVCQGHAYAAVSLRWSRRAQRDPGRGPELNWSDATGLVDPSALTELVGDGDYVVVECTGFARSTALTTAFPEGRGRVDGYLSFERAQAAAKEQLQERAWVFGLDIASLQDRWGVRPRGPVGPRADYRREIAELVDSYARLFVGRRAEMDTLSAFAGRQEPGYLIVEAPAYHGKSALSAHLVRASENGTWGHPPVPDIVCFFVRENAKRNTAGAFLSAVNPQLLQLVGSPEGVGGDFEALRGQFLRLWDQAAGAARAERPLLLLVDGLDEAAGPDIALLLPSGLRDYVHVVVSCRSDQVPVMDDSWHPMNRARRLVLGSLTVPEVEDMLEAAGVDAGLSPALGARVHQLAGGSPIFVSFIVEDVAENGTGVLDTLERTPPTGFSEYFRREFTRMERHAESETAWDLIALLVVARPPMQIQDIADVLGVPKRRVVREGVAQVRRFLRGTERVDLTHLELRRVAGEEIGPADQSRYREKLLAWCMRSMSNRWPGATTPDYVLRYCLAHLAEAAESGPEADRHRRTVELVDAALSPEFQALYLERFKDLAGLGAELDRALVACARDQDAAAPILLVDCARRSDRSRRERLDPEPLFRYAAAGDLDAARAWLTGFPCEDNWRVAVLLTCAWLAGPVVGEQGRALLAELRPNVGDDPTLDRLAHRVAADLEGAPLPAPHLVDPPTESDARAIVARIGGRVDPDGPSTFADAALGGLRDAGCDPLDPGSDEDVGSPAPTKGDGFAADIEGPRLVSFSAASPDPGDRLVRDFMLLHASNQYPEYRRRALWGILGAALHHPRQEWLRALLPDLLAPALAGTSIHFDEAVPLTALAAMGTGPPDSDRFDRAVETVIADADRLGWAPGEGDSWGAYKRRLAALAEAAAVLRGQPDRGAELLIRAQGLPFGYAGYQAPACLTLAESSLVCAPTDAGQAGDLLAQARSAAHNVQERVFCARTTSRVNALARWWTSGRADPAGTIARFVADPGAAAFAAVHVVGEEYAERSHSEVRATLPSAFRRADSLRTLAQHTYRCPVTDLVRLNVGSGWAPDQRLDEGTEVAVPDPDISPLMAAYLSALALVDPALDVAGRTGCIRRLVPLAARNPTALDTVLARLLLAFGASDRVAVAGLATSIPWQPTSPPKFYVGLES